MRRLYEFLEEYCNNDIYPFHMPGHKRNSAFLPNQLLSFDITEIPGADNLHMSSGVISELKRVIAEQYGSKESEVLVNGSSCGILAALQYASYSAKHKEHKIIMSRNAHHSAYHALVLFGAEPIYVTPDILPYGFPGGIKPDDIEKAIKNNPDASAIFITSPTYEGIVSDIKQISQIAHRYHMLLIVDEAHGAHFAFSDIFPKNAISCGADIVINSLHKTLPALGQIAVLHINGTNVDREKLKQLISFTQTSSPSYMLMAQADYMLTKLHNEPEIFINYENTLLSFREKIAGLQVFHCLDKDVCGQNSIFDIDLGKLVFTFQGINAIGSEIEAVLCNTHRVQIEMSYIKHIIAMTSPADTEIGYRRLFAGLLDLEKRYCNDASNIYINSGKPNLPVAACTPKTAFHAEKEAVPLHEAVSRICGEFVTPYPPGVPLIVPGEIITKELISKIISLLQSGIPVIGGQLQKTQKINILRGMKDCYGV